MHIPHSTKFYRLTEIILKKLILFFKSTKNQKLRRAALSAIYLTNHKKFLLKIQKNENFIVHCDELISAEIFLDGSFDFFKFEQVVSIIKKSNHLTTLVDVGANIGSISIPALTRNLQEQHYQQYTDPTEQNRFYLKFKNKKILLSTVMN